MATCRHCNGSGLQDLTGHSTSADAYAARLAREGRTPPCADCGGSGEHLYRVAHGTRGSDLSAYTDFCEALEAYLDSGVGAAIWLGSEDGEHEDGLSAEELAELRAASEGDDDEPDCEAYEYDGIDHDGAADAGDVL